MCVLFYTHTQTHTNIYTTYQLTSLNLRLLKCLTRKTTSISSDAQKKIMDGQTEKRDSVEIKDQKLVKEYKK